MKYTTEKYSELLNGRLPTSSLEFELCDRLIEALNKAENLTISDVSSRLTLFGVFSSDKQLKAVHWSKDGAKQNQERYGKDHYVDHFLIGS